MSSILLPPQIKKLERLIGTRIRKTSLIEAALLHPSFRNEKNIRNLTDFERLEFFGDTILNFIVSENLYSQFPDHDEGKLSHLRSSLVSRKVLARIVVETRLCDFISLGKSERSRPLEEKSKILADALEAVIAAIYFDHGLKAARVFVERHFIPYFKSRRLTFLGDHSKSELQEKSQREWKVLPAYKTVAKNRRFLSTVHIKGIGHAQGEGRSKKEAEKKAAKALLSLLKKKKRK